MARPNNLEAIAGHVTGLREAKATFQALPDVVRVRMLVATETTLQEIVRHAQLRLAASPSIQTRALFNHVSYRLNKKSGWGKAGVASGSTLIGGRRVKGIVVSGRGGSASTSQGAKVIRPSRYAHLVERGTRFFRAEPFMRPAAMSQKDGHISRCRAAGKDVERDMAAIGQRYL